MPLYLKKLVVSYTFDDSKNIDVKDLGQILEPVQDIERTTWQYKVVLFVMYIRSLKSSRCFHTPMMTIDKVSKFS